MRIYLLLITTICSLCSVSAQSKTLQQMAYEAFLNNDLEEWEAVLVKQAETPADEEQQLARAYLLYGALGAAISQSDEEALDSYLDQLESILETLLKAKPKDPEANALMAGAMGMRIAQKPMRGMTLGRKSGKHIKTALAADPDCPIAHYQNGMRLHNTPAIWGGDHAEAAASFTQAQKALEAKGENCESWLYLSTLAWQGIALISDKREDEARAVFAKALSVEPDYPWVKYVLLPKLAQ